MNRSLRSPRSSGLWVICALLLACTPGAQSTLVTVTPRAGDHGTLALSPSGPYAVGAMVTLTATPASGYVVAAWTGTDNDTSTANTNTLTVSTATTSVGVTFELASPGSGLHLTLPGSVLNGTLTASPTEPSGGYATGTVVSLTATPAADFTVDAWSGTDDDSTTATTNSVTMSAAKTVGVTFKSTSPTFTLALTHSGSATLSAASSVPAQAGPSYTTGTVVTLSASVAAGHLVNWTGTDHDGVHTTGNTVTIGSANLTVNAASACDTQCTLTVNVDFPGFGHVDVTNGSTQSTNAATNTFALPKNASVTLTAHDSVNWPFQGWASPATSTGTCTGTIVLSDDRTVSASFPEIASAAKCP